MPSLAQTFESKKIFKKEFALTSPSGLDPKKFTNSLMETFFVDIHFSKKENKFIVKGFEEEKVETTVKKLQDYFLSNSEG